MHFVAALDRVPEMRGVLCLFEGVASGAADGYARMADKPACTLFHLGPGMGNGIANLHNAKKAFTPVVNIVGEHATYHRQFEAPLTSDIEGLAAPFSKWVHVSENSKTVAQDAARAVSISQSDAPGIATLILPADTAWEETEDFASPVTVEGPHEVPGDRVRDAAKALESASRAVILVSGNACARKGWKLPHEFEPRRVLSSWPQPSTVAANGARAGLSFQNSPIFLIRLSKHLKGAMN